MKLPTLILCTIIIILVAGCTTQSPGTQVTVPVTTQATTVPVTTTTAPQTTAVLPANTTPTGTQVPELLSVSATPQKYSPIMSSTIGIGLTANYSGKQPVNYSWETNYGTFSGWDQVTGKISPYSYLVITTGNYLYWTFPPEDTGANKPSVNVKVSAVDRASGKSLADRTVYIGWEDNYTAVVMPEPCGIQNCHGMEISCGPSPAEICTDLYQLGDKCRSLASCRYINNSCTVVAQTGYTNCISCAEQCNKTAGGDPVKAFDCESRC